MGSHDIVTVCDAPKDETSTVIALSVASRGNVTTGTMRAFSLAEMKTILGKMV